MKDLAVHAGVLAAAGALKLHYSTATADGLRWILEPTAWLVSRATGSPFPFEAGVGHVSTELGLILAPECAGVNFLIIAALSLVFGFAHTRSSGAGKAALALASLAVAYLATPLVNTLRILAILRFEPGEELHRILGIAVYLGSLLLLNALFHRTLESRCSARPSSGT